MTRFTFSSTVNNLTGFLNWEVFVFIVFEKRTRESEDLEVFTIGKLIVVFAKQPREHLFSFHTGSNEALVSYPGAGGALSVGAIDRIDQTLRYLLLKLLLQADLRQDSN